MSTEIEAEPGEKFAMIGEATIGCAATHPPNEKFKLTFDLGNFKTAMPRKGSFIVTNKRLAFKGNLSLPGAGSFFVNLGARAIGMGGADMSIPIENIYSIKKGAVIGPGACHMSMIYQEPVTSKWMTMTINIDRWGSASECLEVADTGLDIIHGAEAIGGDISFIPIVGGFVAIGAKITRWKSGRDSVDTWIGTINTIKKSKNLPVH